MLRRWPFSEFFSSSPDPGSRIRRDAGRCCPSAPLYWALTFLAVVFAWVLFRAQTFDGAVRVLQAMLRFDRIAVPAELAGVLPEAIAAVLEPSAQWFVSLRDPKDALVSFEASLYSGIWKIPPALFQVLPQQLAAIATNGGSMPARVRRVGSDSTTRAQQTNAPRGG